MAATLNNNSTAPAKNGKASTAGKQESVVELKDAKSKAPVRPNKDAHERAMNELGAKIDRLKARSEELKNQINGSNDGKSKNAQQRKEIREKIDALRAEQNTFNNSRKAIQEHLKQVQDGIKLKIDEVRKSKEKLSFKSPVDIDRRISELEAQVASGQMTLAEEKRALQDVSALKRQKKSFEAFDSQEDSIEMEKKKVDGLRQRLDALQPEGKRLKDLLDEQFTLLRSLDSEKNDGHSKVKVLIEEREKIGKEIGELMTQRRELYAENKKQNDEWYSYQREEKARRAEQYRLEKTEREKQKKIEAVQRAKEQAEIPAFEVEINTCNALVNLMQQLQGGGAVNAAATNGTTTAASAHVPVSNESAALPKGFTALKKKSDRMDEETLFAGNKKKSAKQQNSSSSSGKEQLKFDLAVLDQFLSLKISVPTTKGDIPQTVDSLKEKKAFFLENQDRVTKENIQKAKDLEEKLLKSIDEPVEAAVGETAAVVEEEAAVVVVEDTPGV